jgi:hypothetical protein
MITKAMAENCTTHFLACECREYRFQQIEMAAADLACAVWRLNEYGFIGTHEEDEEAQCAHWLDIAMRSVEVLRPGLLKEKSPWTG